MTDQLTPMLADRLRQLRQAEGWSLDTLADRSGVSRSTLSRLENSEVSPTAEVLGKLCTAFGLTLSRLMRMVEEQFEPHLHRPDQPVWTDPATGFTRRSVSPPAAALQAEVLDCQIPPGTVIAYDAPPRPGQEQHLVLQSGALTLTLGDTAYDLKPGDCLRYLLHGASRFETGPDLGARYLLVVI